MLIIGGAGGVVSPITAAELAGLNPRLRIAQIGEAGHGIPYDQPERLATTIKTFLQSLNA